MVEIVNSTLRHLFGLLALLAFPFAVDAHRLNGYLQATIVAIEPSGVRLHMNLTIGGSVAEQVLARIDGDHDGMISTNEALAYADSLKRDLVVKLDQRDVELNLVTFYLPPPAELRSGWGIIQMEFYGKLDRLPTGSHTLALENRHLPNSSVYLLNAAQPNSDSLQIVAQNRNETQSAGEIEFSFHPSPSSSKTAGIVCVAILLAALFPWVMWPRKDFRRRKVV
jgi:hypothetical protein